MHIRNDLGMDSMSMLTLIMNLEHYIDGFNANPNYFDDSDFETVSNIVAYVKLQLEINASS
jgi:acyl carrier protein